MKNKRGFFAVGVFNPSLGVNVGGVWRTAHAFGAKFLFTIGGKYKKEASDTSKAWKSLPLLEFRDFDTFLLSRPKDCPIIAVELDSRAISIKKFSHPKNAVYLVGNESQGIPRNVLDKCDAIIQLPGTFCLNLSSAASIVAFDRINKQEGVPE